MDEFKFDRLDPHIKVKALRNLRSQIIYDLENSDQSDVYKQLPAALQVSLIDKRIREVLTACRFTKDGELVKQWKPPVIDPRNSGVFNED